MKKIIIIALIILVVVFVGKKFYTATLPDYPDDQADLILYWGNGCPHCEAVKKYIRDNKLDAKVKISYREVYYDTANQAKLEATVKLCPEVDTSQGIGVPLAFDPKNKKCILGDEPTIEWLKNKTNVTK